MRIVPSNHGWQWLAAGWQLFRASPGMWILMVFTYWFIVALTEQLRYIGPLAVAVTLPAFSMSFMAMCEELRHGRPLRPALLFAGFLRAPAALLTLGGLYLVSMAAVLGVSSLADGGLLLDWMLWGKPPPPQALQEGALTRALLLAAVVALPVFTAFWFAPVLVAWRSMGVAQSLFYSFFACWRNWRAFLVYGIGVMSLGMTITILIALGAMLSGGNPNMVRGLKLGFTLLLLPALFGSFYAAYRDVFPPAPPVQEPPEGEPAQLEPPRGPGDA